MLRRAECILAATVALIFCLGVWWCLMSITYAVLYGVAR
jgi:hypothetical protein